MQQKFNLEGQICVITGATSGLGLESARQLVSFGAKIVMIARNIQKAERIKAEIMNSTTPGSVEIFKADLASLSSVKRVGLEIKSKYPKIHILINNAGLFKSKRTTTEDGYESTFAVDYLAHYLLTNILLDNLKKGAPSRIINVASDIHLFFGLKIDDLQSEKRYRSQKAYGNAKAAMVLHAYELDRQLKNSGVTVNSLHPGHILTKMTTENIPRLFIKLNRKYITPEDASKALVYLAADPELKKVSGFYFQKFKIAKSSKESYDANLQRKLWEKSRSLIEAALD